MIATMHKTFRFFKLSGKKAIILFALTLVLISATVGATTAVIATRTRAIPHTFPPAEVEISSWGFGDVVNAGNVKAYVRANLVAAWVSNDDKRTVWSNTPVLGVDYTLTVEDGWFKASDGFYYREEAINAAASSNFVSANQLTVKDGYTLKILVVYSSIQTNPTDAVTSSWPAVTVDENGRLVEK